MTRATLVTLATTLAFYRQSPLQGLFVLTGLVLGCGLYTAVYETRIYNTQSLADVTFHLLSDAKPIEDVGSMERSMLAVAACDVAKGLVEELRCDAKARGIDARAATVV